MKINIANVRIGFLRLGPSRLARPRWPRKPLHTRRTLLAVEQVESRNLLSASFELPVHALPPSRWDAMERPVVEVRTPRPEAAALVNFMPAIQSRDLVLPVVKPEFSEASGHAISSVSTTAAPDPPIIPSRTQHDAPQIIAVAVDVSAVLPDLTHAPLSWGSLHAPVKGDVRHMDLDAAAAGGQGPGRTDAAIQVIASPFSYQTTSDFSLSWLSNDPAGGESSDTWSAVADPLAAGAGERLISPLPESGGDVDRWSTLASIEVTEPAPSAGGAVDIRHVLDRESSTPMSGGQPERWSPGEVLVAGAASGSSDGPTRYHEDAAETDHARHAAESLQAATPQLAAMVSHRGSQARWQSLEVAVAGPGTRGHIQAGGGRGADTDASTRAPQRDHGTGNPDVRGGSTSTLSGGSLRSHLTPASKAVTTRTAYTAITPRGNTRDTTGGTEQNEPAAPTESALETRRSRDRRTAQAAGFDLQSTLMAVTLVAAATPLLVMERRQADPSQRCAMGPVRAAQRLVQTVQD